METILYIDRQLLYFFNSMISNGPMDKLMPFITDVKSWLLVYIVLFGYLFIKGGKTGRISGVFLILGIVLGDYVNSEILKDYFGRVRPCHTVDDINVLINCSSGKSFPSSHATNNFAAATILSHYYPGWKYALFAVAAIVAFSRVYVGVHYPLDITAGAIVGFGFGFVLVTISKLLFKTGSRNGE